MSFVSGFDSERIFIPDFFPKVVGKKSGFPLPLSTLPKTSYPVAK